MSELILARRQSATALPALVTGLALGCLALAVVRAGLAIPLPGTLIVTDPRELFATFGAAMSGPIGGILVGILAGIGEPIEIWPSVIAHVAAGLGMGLAYKKLVHDRLVMPGLLLGWIALVIGYYVALLIPGFVVGQAIAGTGDDSGNLVTGYFTLLPLALPEMLLTTLVTAVALVALPRRYRRPLW